MTALALAMKIALAAVLLGSILRAFFGAPPRRPAPGAARLIGSGGLVSYAAGMGVMLAGRPIAAGILVGFAVEALCLAAWLGRRGDDGDGPEPGEAPIDWGEFDRARARWDPASRSNERATRRETGRASRTHRSGPVRRETRAP